MTIKRQHPVAVRRACALPRDLGGRVSLRGGLVALSAFDPKRLHEKESRIQLLRQARSNPLQGGIFEGSPRNCPVVGKIKGDVSIPGGILLARRADVQIPS